MDNAPKLLEEFAQASESINSNPLLGQLANAKWKSGLISAVMSSEHAKSSPQHYMDQYTQLARKALTQLGLNPNDAATKNLALTALESPVTKEIRETGHLQGEWLNDWCNIVSSLPDMHRLFELPEHTVDSVTMTNATHFSSLIERMTRFSFLRHPTDLVKWADSHIRAQAQACARQLTAHHDGEKSPSHQNQLNCVRKIFLSAYDAEARQWQALIEHQPSVANLYPNGMPITGVEARFTEQMGEYRNLMGIPATERSFSPSL